MLVFFAGFFVLLGAGFYLEKIEWPQAGMLTLLCGLGTLFCWLFKAHVLWYCAAPAVLDFYLLFKIGLAEHSVIRRPWYLP